MSASPSSRQERSFDPLVFGVSATLTVLFVLWSALFPESMENVVNAAFSWTTEKWGWLYQWTAFLLVGASIVLLGVSPWALWQPSWPPQAASR